MCVGSTLWLGWGGVVSGCRLKHYYQDDAGPINIRFTNAKHQTQTTTVGVKLWFGCGGVVSVCRLRH